MIDLSEGGAVFKDIQSMAKKKGYSKDANGLSINLTDCISETNVALIRADLTRAKVQVFGTVER